jgi:hypothetical protein
MYPRGKATLLLALYVMVGISECLNCTITSSRYQRYNVTLTVTPACVEVLE